MPFTIVAMSFYRRHAAENDSLNQIMVTTFMSLTINNRKSICCLDIAEVIIAMFCRCSTKGSRPGKTGYPPAANNLRCAGDIFI